MLMLNDEKQKHPDTRQVINGGKIKASLKQMVRINASINTKDSNVIRRKKVLSL